MHFLLVPGLSLSPTAVNSQRDLEKLRSNRTNWRKYLSDKIPVQKVLKQGNNLQPPISNFSLGQGIRQVQTTGKDYK